MVDSKLLEWLNNNQGKTFDSPRNQLFDTKTRGFEITAVKSDRVNIKFEEKIALPLLFPMFDRAIARLSANQGKPVRLGAQVKPPYDPATLEGAIWKLPYPGGYTTSYKVAPHICDILVLAGFAKYVEMINPLTNRKVQGAQIVVK
jgi:hypothetical protein